MRRAVLCLALVAPPAAAQGFRLRLDAQAQAVSYRGVRLDSLPVADTLSGVGGGPVTPDGIAAYCVPSLPYCTFFRPGAVRRGGPFTTTADFTMWGFGVPGLSIHALGRIGTAIGSADAWPATSPAVQLLEGYAEYAQPRYTLRLGRQVEAAPLGFTGFDGGALTVRPPRLPVDVTGYIGWGLAQAAALPVTSAALNPLDQFQPVERQLVAGAAAGYRSSLADVRFSYERQVDRRSRYFVSERARVDVSVRPLAHWNLSGSGMYDMAQALWGNAEVRLGYQAPTGVVNASVALRRYRPDFDLWTIWGVFSPVPYRAVDGAIDLAPVARLHVHATGERYHYDDAAASTPLFVIQTSGWRFSWDADYALDPRWSVDGGYHAEFGPGAASRGFSGGVSFAAGDRVTLHAHAGTLARPLEFRSEDVAVRMYGVRMELRPNDRWRVQTDATAYAEARHRLDASGVDWNQVRLSARVVWTFGSGLPSAAVPAAVQAMPDAPGHP
jgi:hypothetical protein